MKSLLALALLFPLYLLHAQPAAFEWGGYAKYLFSRSDAPAAEASYDHLLHARLNTAWFAAENLRTVAEFRFRVFAGDQLERNPYFTKQLGHDAGFGTLGTLLWTSKRSAAYAEIDRLYASWTPKHWQLSAGRQRIAWGCNLVWNPIDLFHPQSVLDFDYEERPAVDALRAQYYTSEVSNIEVAIKPGNANTRAIAAAQWSANASHYDYHIVAGSRAGEWFAGGGWSGDIAGGGFRGELLAAGIPNALRMPRAHAVLFTAAISGDYTFPNSLFIHTEVLYNSEGADAAVDLPERLRAAALSLLSPARWSLYQQLGGNLSALVRADLFAIWNPLDRSCVFVPSLSWSAATNLDLTVLALCFGGGTGSEYGDKGISIFARAKWAY